MHLSARDVNGTCMKDKFGPPRERSPSLTSSVPLSPSHVENSPSPSPQNLHDCSMCFSAYVQSLNTVCGTACRLAQCLAQVGSKMDEGKNGESNCVGSQLPQLFKEVADTWEGIARATGVSSTAVKSQMLLLLQETQARQNLDSESSKKFDSTKIMQIMLSTFLNLHYQFSLVVLERFSGVIQLLNDETPVSSASTVGNSQKKLTTSDGKPLQTSPASPFLHHLSPQLLLQHQSLLTHSSQHPSQQYQQQMLLQQLLARQGHNTAFMPANVSQEAASVLNRENSKSFVGRTPVYHPSQANLSPFWSPSIGSSIDSFSSQNTSSVYGGAGINTLGLFGLDSSNEALFRRWSMGCAAEEAKQQSKLTSLSPFNPMNNRRWSVPETNESGQKNWGGSVHSMMGWDYRSPTLASVRGRGSSKRGLCAKDNPRSPSHSRSVTPDESRRVSLVSNEELLDIIELLSLPLIPKEENTSSFYCPRPAWKSLFLPTGNLNNQDSGQPHHDRIPENENESSGGLSSPPSRTLSSPTINDTSLSPVLSEKGRPKDLDGIAAANTGVQLEQSVWSSDKNIPSAPTSVKGSSKTQNNQISTSLWPPTGNVPGVTLTECLGESDKQDFPPWAGDGMCFIGNSGMTPYLDRGCINRSSWPIPTYSGYEMNGAEIVPGSCPDEFHRVDDWSRYLNVTPFRRHSTDAPYYSFDDNHASLGIKTRSFENISPKLNEYEGFAGEIGVSGAAARDDLFLPSLSLGFAPSPSSPQDRSSQYSLFNASR